jgi:hypothetical protein
VSVPAKPRVGYVYYPRVKFHAHARTRQVRYPRIPVPAGKIAIPTGTAPPPLAPNRGYTHEHAMSLLITEIPLHPRPA